jgi:predicted Rossmann fold flavoprotein
MPQNPIYDIAIIGSGASSLMCSYILNNSKLNIICIDSNKKIGVKIKISGGRKCNITNKNLSYDNYLGDKEFVSPIISKFSNKDILKFLHSNKIFPKLSEKLIKGAYFCNNSSDIINLFSKLTYNINFMFNTFVKNVELNTKDNIFYINSEYVSDKVVIKAKKLIVASGSLSFPALNATNIGANIAKYFNHNIITQNPALVGLCVQKEQFWFKALSGVSLYVHLKVEDKIFKGGFLFTHKGCSGPVVLNASLYWQKGNISVDFDPNNSGKFPKRFKQAIKKTSEFKGIKDIHNYTFAPAGNFGYTKAEVTKGGVDTKQINANTLESKKVKNLYFIGEVLNVTGQLGGYNLSWAFASAFVCAKGILKTFKN